MKLNGLWRLIVLEIIVFRDKLCILGYEEAKYLEIMSM